jgi:shikimate kinase
MIELRVMVNIYLVGFMGAGKTSVGKHLARRLEARFLDLDEMLQERFGCSIPEVFRQRGESAFRTAETEEIERLSGRGDLVVATGGGAFASEINRRNISESGGISVFLDVPWEVLERRLEEDGVGRPLYDSPRQARDLYDARMPHYRCATLTIALTGYEMPAEVAGSIAASVREALCAT